jgi:hypothetical protein
MLFATMSQGGLRNVSIMLAERKITVLAVKSPNLAGTLTHGRAHPADIPQCLQCRQCP